MKKVWAMVLFLVLLAGCGRSDVVTNVNEVFSDWGYEYHEPAAITTYDSPAFGDTLGFDVITYPNDTSYILEKCFSIDLWYGQLEYRTDDERYLVLRMARDNSSDIHASYSEPHTQDKRTLERNNVTITITASQDGNHMVYWVKDGFQYILHGNKRYPAPSDTEIYYFVSTLECRNSAASASNAV